LKSKTLFIQTQTQTIPKNWELVELQQISKIIDSLHVTPKYSSEGTPMVRSTNIKTGNLNLENAFHVSEDVYKKFTKNHRPQKDDIVMSRVGTYFPNSFVNTDQPFCLGQNTVVIHPSIISRFVYYALNSKLVQGQINELLVGSGGQKTISLEDIRELLILKSKDSNEIKQIAKILYDLDATIENLQNQNKILEQISQAVFKSWFINFDGVTEFDDSEIGEIPKGWKVGKLEHLLELTKGVSYKSKELMHSHKALVTLKSIKVGGGYTERGLKSFDGKYNQNQIVHENDIVIAQTTVTQNGDVIGKPAIIQDSKEFDVLIASLDLLIVRSKNNDVPKSYLYHLFMTDYFQNHIYGYTNGSVVLHLLKDGVPTFQFALPPKKILEQYDKLVSIIIQKNHDNKNQIKTLMNIHDILLPKLMSGEIRV